MVALTKSIKWLTWVILIATVVGVLLTAWSVLSGPYPPSQNAIALGMFTHDAHRVENIDAYANLVGKQPAFVENFAPWESPWPGVDTGFNEDWARAVDSRGAKPVFLWYPIQTANYGDKNQPDYQLSDIIRGDHDPYLRAWAQEAKVHGKTVYVRLMPEANGSWASFNPYNNGNAGPQEFIDAWRHVVDVVRVQEGATNVKFAWTMGAHYYKGVVNSNTLPLAQLYPGDSYVDVVGLDSYVNSSNYITFEELFGRDYDDLVALSNRPVWISEVGFMEHPTDPTAKAGLIRTGLLTTVPSRFPRVSAVGYWHEYPYHIDTSQAALTAYREVAANQLYQGQLP
jgi:mannan endo-1,4-beta-mannosidase